MIHSTGLQFCNEEDGQRSDSAPGVGHCGSLIPENAGGTLNSEPSLPIAVEVTCILIQAARKDFKGVSCDFLCHKLGNAFISKKGFCYVSKMWNPRSDLAVVQSFLRGVSMFPVSGFFKAPHFQNQMCACKSIANLREGWSACRQQDPGCRVFGRMSLTDLRLRCSVCIFRQQTVGLAWDDLPFNLMTLLCSTLPQKWVSHLKYVTMKSLHARIHCWNPDDWCFK